MKRKTVRLCVAAALFFTALFVNNTIAGPVIFACAALLCGYGVFVKAGRNIIRGNVFDENFLMSVACIGAFIIGQFAEGCAVLLLFCVGELLEAYAVGKSRKAIAELMDIRPDHANLVADGKIMCTEPESVEAGSIIEVCPGERVPLDGVVVSGRARLDTSSLTGEPLPKEAFDGERVLSGSIVTDGVIRLRTESRYTESTVSRVLELVENAAEKKTKTENFISRFSAIYTPCVVAAAVFLAVIPSVITKDFRTWVYRALDFLVVSCPCALVISVPLSYFGGMGNASKKGILIKGSSGIEALSKVKAAVFDKTGTLTQGKFSITEIICRDISREELLYYAASCESVSSHPIAKAIAVSSVKKSQPQNVTEKAGFGISAEVDGVRVTVGKPDDLNDAELYSGYGTAVYVMLDGVYKGCIVLEDSPKENAYRAIRALKEQGVSKTIMLTGDTRENAEHIAETLGIDEVYPQLLPNEKVAALENIMEKYANGTVLYAGDGINDAPVLARADVGAAMGGIGADCAVEAADVVMMNDDMEGLPRAVAISKRTMRIVRENIVFSIAVKILILVLCAFGVVGMWAAVFGDVGVTVLAVVNALRAMDKKASM